MTLPLLEPILSEKAVRDQERGVYRFWAPPEVTKRQAVRWLEKIFGVEVVKARSLQRRGKVKMNWRQRRPYRQPSRKQFLIQLAPGKTIKELAVVKK